MPYKQNPKSPILKALVGNQHKLPQHLQEAIKAAPESPAKKSGPGDKKKAVQNNLKGATVGAARQLLKEAGVNDPNISPSNVLKYAKQKGYLQEARNMAKQGLKQNENNYTFGDSNKKKYL